MRLRFYTFCSLLFLANITVAQINLDTLYAKITAYYSFDRTLNEEVNNSLNLNHGHEPLFALGYQNESFNLTKDSTYLEIPHDYALLDSNRTLSLWFYVDSIPNEYCQIIDKSHGSDYSINITQDTSLNVHFRYNKDLIRKVKVPIRIRHWNHLVVTVSNNVLSCYLNKKRFEKSPVPEPSVSNYEAILGGGGTPYTPGYQFYGRIDELVFFEDALNSSEISLLFANGIKMKRRYIEVSDFERLPANFDRFKSLAPELNDKLDGILTDTAARKKAMISNEDFWQIVNYKLAQSDHTPPKPLVRRTIPTTFRQTNVEETNDWIYMVILFVVIFLLTTSYVISRRVRKGALEMTSASETLENKEDQKVIFQLSTLLKEKSKILQEMGEDLKVLSKENNADFRKELIHEMESKIRMSTMLSKEVREIDASANKIRTERIEKLKKAFPKLTNNDLKLIELLIAGMSSKEISIALHISPQSVDTGRYRLRKKLKLKQSENLVYFLKNQ